MASNKRLKRIRNPAIFAPICCSVFEAGVTGLRLSIVQYLKQASNIRRQSSITKKNKDNSRVIKCLETKKNTCYHKIKHIFLKFKAFLPSGILNTFQKSMLLNPLIK